MWWLLSVAWAGYGDPVAGVPSALEREVHAWTSAVRVDPEAFADDYACAFSGFSSSEKTPKPPLLWNQDLGDAARFHSEDMDAIEELSHASSDGTSFEARVARYYESPIVGENVAWNYGSPFATVIEGWMCSSGHRENIMRAGWNELGTGISGEYYTQDFGERDVSLLGHPLMMGAHRPAAPTSSVTFLAVFHDTAAPTSVEVVVDGTGHPMTLTWGEGSSGVYTAELSASAGCTKYSFRAQLASGGTTRFPADGQYGWGDCAWDDADAQWIAGAGPVDPPDVPGGGGDDTGDPDHFGIGDTADADDDGEDRDWRGCGCDGTGGGPVGWGVVGLLLLVGLLRARSSAS